MGAELRACAHVQKSGCFEMGVRSSSVGVEHVSFHSGGLRPAGCVYFICSWPEAGTVHSSLCGSFDGLTFLIFNTHTNKILYGETSYQVKKRLANNKDNSSSLVY